MNDEIRELVWQVLEINAKLKAYVVDKVRKFGQSNSSHSEIWLDIPSTKERFQMTADGSIMWYKNDDLPKMVMANDGSIRLFAYTLAKLPEFNK